MFKCFEMSAVKTKPVNDDENHFVIFSVIDVDINWLPIFSQFYTKLKLALENLMKIRHFYHSCYLSLVALTGCYNACKTQGKYADLVLYPYSSDWLPVNHLSTETMLSLKGECRAKTTQI